MTAPGGTAATKGRPELIYHYTNAQGLKGIIENRAIWATDVWYMNDTREATFGLDVIEEFLKSKLSDTDERSNKRAEFCLTLLQSLRQQNDRMPGSFIACFSKNGDQLSQWRAYGTTGGFAMGFDKGALEKLTSEMTETSQHTMREVIYDKGHQFLALDSHYARISGDFSDIGVDSPKFIGWAYMLTPALKNAAFSEEAEVRLHLFQDTENTISNSLKFRISAMGLTPYMPIKLWADGAASESPIREIVIGPTTYHVQTERAVRQFLDCSGLKNVELRHSAVPLRP